MDLAMEFYIIDFVTGQIRLYPNKEDTERN